MNTEEDPLLCARGILLGLGLALAGWAVTAGLAYLTAWLLG